MELEDRCFIMEALLESHYPSRILGSMVNLNVLSSKKPIHGEPQMRKRTSRYRRRSATIVLS
jgi:hypothetical protein